MPWWDILLGRKVQRLVKGPAKLLKIVTMTGRYGPSLAKLLIGQLVVVQSVRSAFEKSFVQGGGGPALQLTGTINTVAASTTITGTNTLFTTELHVGAEIAIAGQYFTVTAIASNTSMTVL